MLAPIPGAAAVLPVLQVAERKLAEVTALKGGSAPDRAAQSAESELASLLQASPVVSEAMPGPDAERLLQLVRSCGFAANSAGDFEAASNWFDCSFAISAAPSDLVSSANMRAKLLATSPVAALIYRHVLGCSGATDKVREVAQRKLSALEAAADTVSEGTMRSSNAGDVSYRAYA